MNFTFSKKFLTLILSSCLCFACAHKSAPIVNKSSQVHDRSTSRKHKSVAKTTETIREKPSVKVTEEKVVTLKQSFETNSIKAEAAPVKNIESVKTANKPTAESKVFTLTSQNEEAEVMAGDTLYSLSRKHQTTQEEIIKLNNLATPYTLKIGSKIIVRKVAAKMQKAQQIEVKNGDSLLQISKDYQVTLRDLIKQNNLTPPYNLKVGQKITIPAPNYHEVKPGETLYAISRLYNMKVDDLIRMNDLQAPYSVKVGEKLRITNLNESSASEVATKVEESAKPAVAQPAKTVEKVEKKSTEPTIIADKNNKFSWPLNGEIISKFGPKSGGLYNDGVNIKAAAGSPVKAAEDGVIAYVGNELKGYGNLVIVKHSSGWITAYAHLSETLVTRGQKVVRGEKIAKVGATGNVKSPQLYFGLRKGRDAVNPENYLKKS